MSTNLNEIADRRPIATREKRWAQAAAAWLARRGASPNAVSVSGMISGCCAGAAFAATAGAQSPSAVRVWFFAGAVAVQLRLVANMLDGMVAIESGKSSRVGELYNEVPDRVSDAATLIGLGYAVHSHVALGYIAACLAVFIAYVRVQGKVAGAPQDFVGPMAKQHRMFTVTLAALFMALTPAAWQVQWTETPTVSAPTVALAAIIAGGVLTAMRRLRRIARALRQEPAQ